MLPRDLLLYNNLLMPEIGPAVGGLPMTIWQRCLGNSVHFIINTMLSKFLKFIKSQQQTIFLSVCLVLVSVISYNLGQVNALQKTPLKITGKETNQANVFKATSLQKPQTTATNKPKPTDLRVVVSKKSTTKKYHYAWCSGAQRIKEENRVWFATAGEAESAGYTLAGNCEL